MSTNDYKAVFILSFLLGNVIAFAHSLIALLSSGGFTWFLALVASASVLYVFFIHIGTGKRARTSRNLNMLLAAVTVLAGLSVIFGNSSIARIYTVFVSCLGAWAYIYWYSTLDRSGSLLKEGESLPGLQFFLPDGKELSTASLDQSLILVFYRGNWCPLCTAQVQEMADHYQQLSERGYQVLMISPQSEEETAKIARRFDVPMLFCEDRDGDVAKQLGIFHERALPYGMEKMGYSADAVFPTVVITDKNHKIIWLDQTDNYRVRPEPQDFIRVIDELQPA